MNIFDYCAELYIERIECKGLLGVVIETVRMFLAEWLVTGERVPVWDPALPMSLFDFGLNEASVLEPDDELDIMFLNRQLIFICQRELQRKIARMYSNDENLL